jgi:hypothetical protein
MRCFHVISGRKLHVNFMQKLSTPMTFTTVIVLNVKDSAPVKQGRLHDWPFSKTRRSSLTCDQCTFGKSCLINNMWRTHKVTLRGVRAVEKQWTLHNLSVCIYTVRYPACNVNAPYCHLWPTMLCNIYPHYLINGTTFEKKSHWAQNVFWFTLELVPETFNILRRTERDMIKNVKWSSCKVPSFLSDFNENLIFLDILSKYAPKQISWKSVQWKRVVPCGRTDGLKVGRTDLTNLIAAVRNFANAPKNADVRNVGQAKVRQGKCHALQLSLFKWLEVAL